MVSMASNAWIFPRSPSWSPASSQSRGQASEGTAATSRLQDRSVTIHDDRGVQADLTEQVVAGEQAVNSPSAAAREPTQGAMVAVREGAVVLVDKGNDDVNQPIAEAIAGWQVPVAVIGEDHDERWRITGVNELVRRGRGAKVDPLFIGVGLAVQQIQDRERASVIWS